MSSPCADRVNAEHPEVSKSQADELLQRLINMAKERAKTNGGNIEKAMEEVTKFITQRDKLKAAVAKRNTFLNLQAETSGLDYIQRYPLLGDGILGKLVGSKHDVPGGRDSIATQIKVIDHGYLGRIGVEMIKEGVFREFRRNEITKEIYQEMGELKPDGTPGISGNIAAQKIAKILHTVTSELVARLNRAGAAIAELPGWTARQTHDITKLRAAGPTQTEARGAWETFILPRLDWEKTFLGEDKGKFLLDVFNALYSGVHGVMGVEGEGIGHRALATKWSQERILHFKDATAAWEYNERFGSKDFSQQVISDLTAKARAIAIMENLGPNAQATVLNITRRARELARVMPDAAAQLASISDKNITSAFNQLTGVNEIPQNPTLARTMGNVRAVIQMAKMGGVALTNLFTDRAFMQSDAAFQGIKNLDTLGKQITSFAKKTESEKSTLRLMGVGIDGWIGNALSRYSATGPVSGIVNRAQKIFFDINFNNYITDTSKSAYAELMATYLGEHAELPHAQLKKELSHVLALYDIGPKEWDLLRATAYDHPSGMGKMITPDQLTNLTDAQISTLHEGEKAPSAKVINKIRERLKTQLSGYFIDRVDYGTPTPGPAERMITTLDTRSGTGLGEAVRLLMLFKSFPVTVANRVLAREIYGRGNKTIGQWALNDHPGKFHMAQLAAMTIIAGYIGMTIRDALRGRTPRELIVDGKINLDLLTDAAVQGGGLGIMGEMVMKDYGRGQGSFLEGLAGPAIGQLDQLAEMKTKVEAGEPFGAQLGKMAMDNTPLLNLFYIRPILNYYVLWNLQEMMNPGSLKRIERNAEEKNKQGFFIRPSEVINN